MVLNAHCPPELSSILETVSPMLSAGCKLVLPLLPKVARDCCLDLAMGLGSRRACSDAGAGSLAWEGGRSGQLPRNRALVPSWGPPLKLAGNSHTAGTERRRETQVDSVLCTDTLFKENSLDNGWQIMNEWRRETSLPRPEFYALFSSRLSPAGLGTEPQREAVACLLFLTFNIYHAVLKMLRTDTGGALMGGVSRCLVYSPAPREKVEAERAPGFHR